ncbi:ECF RNA polymerase sigma-E factor [Polystyrenella longa]|uniref:ECF RNA polymerase sigma-E factor n=1 Tax=Polystyrenella longa TaxID=2528007 RepID=A0A518CS84_9PLAN|nr:sigma-70 family RNA polymerase sigma factor [Polystyrenella longa]QDU82073.1 ECF RNA polymerase sigma-E factor [Polystyrenella longa]
MPESSSAPFRALLDQVRQGDATAKNQLLEQYRPYLQMLARSQFETWMQSKNDASDIVQESMLDACRGLQQFQGQSEGEWLAWLKQIVAHNLQDQVRHFKGAAKRDINLERSWNYSPNCTSGQFERAPGSDDPRPSQIMMQSEQEQQLAWAISQLSDDYREVIRLRNLQRLPFNEVADQMNRSRTATQMLWTRAMVKLSEAMKSQVDEF